MQEREKKIEKNTKKAHKDFIMEYVPYLIIVLFVIIIRTFIATPIKVSGSSMLPTLEHNDTMVLYKLTKHVRGIKRFDIVVIKSESGKLIKRVIGLPGDTIKYSVYTNKNGEKVGKLYVNGKEMEEKFLPEASKLNTCITDWQICVDEIQISENQYFVMGDNRGASTDSRIIGTVSKEEILGTTKLIIFPFKRFGFVK